ncbi:hypothetical protein F5884DRAFT_687621 [Xylogone sp. PMI_703]|nr:hypothetical protein F5884DRAFT_687621 [Xylogone sp. PMI_703]
MPSTVLVPLQLSAFVLNEAVCASAKSKIAPITQPNYTFLRLSNSLIQPDVLDHADLHSVSPALLNPRLTDLGTGQLHRNRVGVYLQWTLPRVYRSGMAATASAMKRNGTTDPSVQADRKLQQGYPVPQGQNTGKDYSAPEFRPVPNRWLVVRRIIDMTTISPSNAASTVPGDGGITEFDAWVIESDRLRNINDDDFQKADFDIEVDTTPFVSPAGAGGRGDRVVDGQAEIFIGKKTNAVAWKVAEADAAACVQPLTVLTSSNPLFADYQPHNSNVFSMVDNFMYTKVVNNDGGATKYLDKASADYYVLGWHSRSGEDPFTTAIPDVPSRADRLKDCLMALKADRSDIAKNWLTLKESDCRALCHSTMYTVNFDANSAPRHVLADDAGHKLESKQPIALGITPLDALLAFINAHVPPRKPGDPVSTDLVTEMEQDILSLQTLLQNMDDDVDGQSAALDEMYVQAFTKYDGGTEWHYSAMDSTGKPVIPDPAHLDTIRSLNKSQKVLDTANREASELRWRLFAEWWNYVSGLSQTADVADAVDPPKSGTPLTADQIARQKARGSYAIRIKALLDGLHQLAVSEAGTNAEKGTDERFYQRKDPTLLFGGIKSAWASDFLDPLPVRGEWQIVDKSPVSRKEVVWRDRYQIYVNSLVDGIKLPTTELTKNAKALLMELWHLRPSASTSTIINVVATPEGVIPFFHDETTRNPPEARGRDRWQDQQPWFPLFIEWEAVYYHIPWKEWSLHERPRHSDGMSVLQYGCDRDISGITDTRTVSGRVLVLPQPSYTLSANVKMILDNTFKGDLEAVGIDDTERAALLKNIKELDFISAPLSGLTRHLLTLHEGQHVKPTVRAPNSAPRVIEAALVASSPAGFTQEMLELMEADTTLTPYGNSAAISQDFPPAKLATHGHLMFTKINIIDKFGQAICAIPQEARFRDPKTPKPTIYPCLSDSLFPDMVGSKINSVVVPADPTACCVAKLAPSINQPARLNAHFVVRDPANTTAPWRPCDQWENPIWGWLVVNYADYGLQLFLKDGTFYREVRLGGPSGTVAGERWLPFDPPRVLAPDLIRDVTQLDFLIDQLTTKDSNDYLFAFFDMINQSVALSGTHAPNDYAAFLPAIVGKPLALVNTGWSIEVFGIERRNWSTLNANDPDIGVVDGGGNDGTGPIYEFNIKLGDSTRTFDGVVGYFPAWTNDITPGGPQTPLPVFTSKTSDLKLNQLYTYFMDNSSNKAAKKASTPNDPRIQISPSNYHTFRPYYTPAGVVGSDVDTIQSIHNSKMKVYGMIVDPFTPIHAYSAILPNRSLTLPPWTVQAAFKEMTAFFHVGPIITTKDVPPTYDMTHPLTGEYSLTDDSTNSMTTAAAAVPQPTVAIPVVGAAEWNWLQPYRLPTSETKYNALKIEGGGTAAGDASSTEIRLERAPYTGIEGFLQLVRPVVDLKDLTGEVVKT